MALEQHGNVRFDQIKKINRHGDKNQAQASDGTGTVTHFAQYLADGSITDSTISPASIVTVGSGGGPGGTSPNWYEQVPVGPQNSINKVFALDFIPISPPTGTPPVVPVIITINGVAVSPYSGGYTLIPGSNIITMGTAPKSTDEFICWYFPGPPAALLAGTVDWTLRVTSAWQNNSINSGDFHVSQYGAATFAFGQIPFLSGTGSSAWSTRLDTTDITSTTLQGVTFDPAVLALDLSTFVVMIWMDNYPVDPGIVNSPLPYSGEAYADIYDVRIRATFLDSTFIEFVPYSYTIVDGEGLGSVSLAAVDTPGNAVDGDLTTAARVHAHSLSGLLWTLAGNTQFSLTDFVSTVPLATAQTITFPTLTGISESSSPVTLGATSTSGLNIVYTAIGPATITGPSQNLLMITGPGPVTVTASQPGDSNTQPAPPVVQIITVAPTTSGVPAQVHGDMLGSNEGAPHGVPPSYDFSSGPFVGMGNSPAGNTALEFWGDLYVGPGGNPATNTLVNIKNVQLFWLQTSTSTWHVTSIAASDLDSDNFSEDFTVDYSTPVTIRTEGDGSFSFKAVSGKVSHFFAPYPRVSINPSDFGGVVIVAEARLILDNGAGIDDRSIASFLLGVGADYYPTTTSAGIENNPGVAGGKFKYVQDDWRSVCMTTLSLADLTANPPTGLDFTGILA